MSNLTTTQAPAQAPAATAQASDAGTVVAKGTIIPGEPEYQLDPLLTRILRTRRRHGSQGDMNFRTWLFNHIRTQLKLQPTVKEEGNIYVTTDAKSTVLFSCHVDSVHRRDESDNGDQALAFDPVFGHLFLADKSKSSCLGGDDGVGVYILLKMLEKGVAGHYMFHTGEEVGGVGSSAFVRNNRTFIDEIEAVVAFDRKCVDGEDNEVIITQGGSACASETFGLALAKSLSNPKWGFNNKWITSHKGTFTDSKNYAQQVPECVNIGCFYDRQHTSNETVNVYELDKLVKALVEVEWKMLPIVRKPTVYGGGGYNGQTGFGFGREMYDFEPPKKPKAQITNGKKLPPKPVEVDLQSEVELIDTYRMKDIEELVDSIDTQEMTRLLALLAIELRKTRAENDLMRTMLELDV